MAGEVQPAAPGQRIVVDVSAPSGRVVSSVQVSTTANGTFQARMDLRKVLARFGAGTYTVQAPIIDADELDDAEVQRRPGRPLTQPVRGPAGEPDRGGTDSR